MKVLRVEKPDGLGPYAGRVLDCSEKDNWPIPSNNIRYQVAVCPQFIFGFKSLSQVFSWFNADERIRLATLDFILAIYETVDAIECDETPQLIFNKEKSKKVATLELRGRESFLIKQFNSINQ